MTQTLRTLIETNDFAGYEIKDAAWSLEPKEIEEAIYGVNANDCLPYDFVSLFAKTHQFEIIALNTWICSDTPVGLNLLRLDGIPVALTWQSGRKDDQLIHFLSKDALQAFKTKWDALKQDPETDGAIIHNDVLDMPLAPQGETRFEVAAYGNDGMPGLTKSGVDAWLKSIGGLEKANDVAPLCHALGALQRNLQAREYFLKEIEGMPPAQKCVDAEDFASKKDTHLAALRQNRDDIAASRDAILARIKQIGIVA